jgi:hypothetical protein
VAEKGGKRPFGTGLERCFEKISVEVTEVD